MRCSRPTMGPSMSSFCTPFCSEMTAVSGPISGRIWRPALSVSRSFTEKITMSTLPMVLGSSVAFTFGRLDRLHAFDFDAVLLQSVKLRAACDESHVRAAILKHRAVVAADAARTHDRDFHNALRQSDLMRRHSDVTLARGSVSSIVMPLARVMSITCCGVKRFVSSSIITLK